MSLSILQAGITTVGSEKHIYPATTMTMKDVNIFLNLLAEGTPFGYGHFNDGEIRSIEIKNCHVEIGSGQRTTDFGWQNCSEELSTAMKNALTNTAPNFYVGIPCACEWHADRTKLALNYLGLKSKHRIFHKCAEIESLLNNILFKESVVAKPWLKERLTVATAFINGNYARVYGILVDLLGKISSDGNRVVHAISGSGARFDRLQFKVNAIEAASRHAFERNYSSMRTRGFVDAHFRAGDVVLLMLGPLGRILASEWTLITPNVTFLDMGSFWDQELTNRTWKANEHSMRRPCNARHDVDMGDEPIPKFRSIFPP